MVIKVQRGDMQNVDQLRLSRNAYPAKDHSKAVEQAYDKGIINR